MNIVRIFKFALVLLALQVVISTVITYFLAGGDGVEESTVLWVIINYLIKVPLVIMLFMKLARVQKIFPYIHAFLVVVLSELFGIALFVVIVGDFRFSAVWPLEYFLLALSVVAGTAIGTRVRPV